MCINIQTVVFSSVSNLMPGLSLTLSIMEISAGHIVCGITRFFAALFTALMLGFGYTLASSFAAQNQLVASDVDWKWVVVFTPILAFMTCLIFGVGRNKLAICIAIACAGFATNTLLSAFVFLAVKEVPIIVAAGVIGLLSNLYAKLSGDIAVASVVVSIYMIVNLSNSGSRIVRCALVVAVYGQKCRAGT
jgi:Putative threonine/serine exporter